MVRKLILLLAISCHGFAHAQTLSGAPESVLDVGNVRSSVRQASNKLVVGGTFTKLSGQARVGLGRVNTDGTLDGTFVAELANAGFEIKRMLADAAGNLFLCGNFGLRGSIRTNLVKIDANGAVLNNFGGSISSGCNDIVFDAANNALYVAGEFEQINGQARLGVAKLHGDTGAVDLAFNAQVDRAPVLALSLAAGRLYLAGAFDRVGSLTVQNLARVNPTSGAVDSTWLPNSASFNPNQISTLLFDGSSFLYAGGSVALGNPNPVNVVGVFRFRTTGSPVIDSAWSLAIGEPQALALDSGGLFVGGKLRPTLAGPRRFLLQVSIANSAQFSAFAPELDGAVSEIKFESNGDLRIAGNFARAAESALSGVAQFSNLGVVRAGVDLAPRVPGVVRTALSLPGSGQTLIGGDFVEVDGQRHERLALLQRNGQPLAGFTARTDATVRALAADSNGNAYIGGSFTRVNGTPRIALAKLAVATATLDAIWLPAPISNSAPDIAQLELLSLASNNELYVAGDFVNIGGQARSNIAKLSTHNSGSAIAAWAAPPGTSALAMAADRAGGMLVSGPGFSASVVRLSAGSGQVDAGFAPFVVGAEVTGIFVEDATNLLICGGFDAVNGLARKGLARLNLSGTVDPAFVPNTANLQSALTRVGNFIYASGDAANLNISGLVRVFADSGALDASFAPQPDGLVTALAAGAAGALVVGGEFSRIDAQQRLGIAQFGPEILFRDGFE